MTSEAGVRGKHALSPKRLAEAMRHASWGVARAIHTEPNLRFHFICSTVVLCGCLVIRPTIAQVTWALCTCAFVCIMELVNTAVERVVDIASDGQWMALAGYAKDAAAGAVLVSGLTAIGIGSYLLFATYPWQWRLFSRFHAGGALESVVGLMVIAWFCWLSWRVPAYVDGERNKEETR